MSFEEFNLIVTSLHHIEFGLGVIAGILFGRWLFDVIKGDK